MTEITTPVPAITTDTDLRTFSGADLLHYVKLGKRGKHFFAVCDEIDRRVINRVTAGKALTEPIVAALAILDKRGIVHTGPLAKDADVLTTSEKISLAIRARVRVFHRPFSEPEDKFLDHGPDPSINEVVQIARANAPDPTANGDMGGVAEPQPPLQNAHGAPDPHRLVLSRFQHLGAGDRLRLLDRIGIPRAEIQGLPPHKQIREVASRVVASSQVDAFLAAASEIEAADAAGRDS